MRLHLLRVLLILDAAVLVCLAGLLLFMPDRAMHLFHFEGLPAGVTYLIGIMGCLFGSMGLGYLVAAQDPLRHVAWIQVALLRGAMECIFGLVCMARGLVTFQEAGFGIVAGVVILVSYGALYPRE